MRTLHALILILLLPLLGCKTAPTVQLQAICPRIPALDQRPAAQEPSFTNKMQSFLQGNLTEPSAYSLTLTNAKLPTSQPAKP